jgi:hypothetical protein
VRIEVFSALNVRESWESTEREVWIKTSSDRAGIIFTVVSISAYKKSIRMGLWGMGGTSKREIVALRREPSEKVCPGLPCAEEITAAESSEREFER